VETRLQPEAGEASRENWYDAAWLAKFIEAKTIVARVAPSRLREFDAAFDVLRVPPDFSQRFLAGLLSADQLERVRETVRAIPMDKLELHEIEKFGRFIVHDWPEFTALQAELVDVVSEAANEAVEPSYNFLSLYTKMGVCQPHLDTPSAKWTLDVCIGQSEPWPIHFSQPIAWPERLEDLRETAPDELTANSALYFTAEVLMLGDAILFSGTNQWHYREALPPRPGKQFCDLLFFHYVPFGTADLIQPRNWARLFDIPQLAEMADLDRFY
jgi:hypothetical protein